MANKIQSGANFTRTELRARLADYRKIIDCVTGESAIKKGATTYLPMPNADDQSSENMSRYAAYLARAVFYNVTQNTLSGLVGEVFRKDPVEEIPTALEVVLDDANGDGLTLTQFAKKATRFTLSLGRAGILTDYPAIEGGVSKADINGGSIQPTITVYRATEIINWKTSKTLNKTVYTLIVLKEFYDSEDDADGFSVTLKEQIRVLRLRDGVYGVQLYRSGAVYGEEIIPTDSNGNSFDVIPFTFIGSENNDSEVDYAPMLSIASINIGHYHNSADYEESSFTTGQPTVVVSGITEEWAKNVLNGELRMGARGGIMLPEGGGANLLQTEPNTMPFEAMLHKERQMVALGAKLVENKEVQRTATEAGIDNANETSVLANIAKNVSAAIVFALEFAARFVGVEGEEIKYALNTDFMIARMTAQDRAQIIAEWQGGAITFEEMRGALRKTGVATLDDDAARAAIDTELDEAMKRSIAAIDTELDDDDVTGGDE